jgi:hypothetical protein
VRSLSAGAVRFFGICAILSAFGAAFLYAAVKPGGHGYTERNSFLYMAAFLAVSGLGALLLRHWGAILLALASLFLAVLFLIATFRAPFPWFLINFFCAALASLPALFTIYAWRELL